MTETVNEAELGRSKKSDSPGDHLQHLLGLGWSREAPLIRKYVLKYRLQADLAEWERLQAGKASLATAQPKLKNGKV